MSFGQRGAKGAGTKGLGRSGGPNMRGADESRGAGGRGEPAESAAGMSPKLKGQLSKIGKLVGFLLLCVYGPHLVLFGFPSFFAIDTSLPPDFLREPSFRIQLHDAKRTPSQVEEDVARACLPAKIGAARRENAATSGVIAFNYREATSFVACATTIYEERLCDPVQRRRLAGNLASYAREWRRIIDFAAKIDPHGIGAMGAALSRGASPDMTVGSPLSSSFDRDVGAGIWKLSESGYLAASDFGRTVPLEIQPYLRPAQVASCR